MEDPERLRELQESLGRPEDFAAQRQAENTPRAYVADLEDFRHWCKIRTGVAARHLENDRALPRGPGRRAQPLDAGAPARRHRVSPQRRRLPVAGVGGRRFFTKDLERDREGEDPRGRWAPPLTVEDLKSITQAIRAGKAERRVKEHSGHESWETFEPYVEEAGPFPENPAEAIGL